MTTGPFTRLIVGIFVSMAVAGHAQQPQIGVPVPPLGAGPFVFDTAEQHKIRVTGSAKKRIVSDLIEWSATLEANARFRSTRV